MEKLITDDPKTNAEALLNFAYMGQDRRVKLRNVEGFEEVDVAEYVATDCCEYGDPQSSDDVLDGAVMECACVRAYLYYAAVQAAELRERLRAYEAIGLSPVELSGLKHRLEMSNAERPARVG